MHKIAIPQSVIDRLVKIRGRRHLHDQLEGSRTALVVIDMQNVFMLPGMPVAVPAACEIVPAINRLAAAVRGAGGLVAWVKMTAEAEPARWSVFYDRAATEERRAATIANLASGCHGHDLHADLTVDPRDLVLEKTRFSAFIQGSSQLDALLRSRGIDTVIVVGTLTNVCCDSTARDAMMLDYKMVFVADANAAITDEEHNATLVGIVQAFGDVMTTDEVVERLIPTATPVAHAAQ